MNERDKLEEEIANDPLWAAEEMLQLRAALNKIRSCRDWYTATKIACEALGPTPGRKTG